MKPVIKKKPTINTKLKRLGLLFLLIPLGILFLFLFGEVIGGDISGLGHLIQIIPLLLLGYFAIKYPFIGGIVFIVVGLVFSVLFTILNGFVFLIADSLLFLPLIISGILLVISSRPK
jgi:hypothetical protein